MATNIVDLYESIKIYDCELLCVGKEKKLFKSPSSIHSEVTDWAYGKMIERECIDISDGSILTAKFNLTDTDARFKIKLNATLVEWEKHTIDITIKVNGKVAIKSPDVLLENVNLGWPSVYFDIDKTFFNPGENLIEISTDNCTEGGLLVSEVCVLEFPDIKEKDQISVRKFVKLNDVFGVAIFDSKKEFSVVENLNNCVLNKSVYFDDVLILSFLSKNVGKSSATAVFNQLKIDLAMPEIVVNDDFFLLGTDSDDHRHDDSEELKRIMQTMIFSDICNFIQFRPKYIRNYITFAPNEVFEKYVQMMDLFGMKYGLVDGKNLMGYLPENHPENFYGYHVHEPYHFFNTGIEKLANFGGKNSLFNFDGLRKSESFSESKELFKDYLRKTKEKNAKTVGLTSVGSPSLLCVYEGDAGFDRITIEPVSNINILLGAVRASSAKCWGAHVPTDWYFGIPVDEVKSNKYRLAMQYCYLNGASYVYAENALFKTNAFDRLDFEDEHCSLNRKYLRDFYEYTIKHPRKGELIVDKAFMFGRNEFIMWQTNDRMGELKEKDWDLPVWGKWDNAYQDCYHATESWMPISTKQNSIETPLNTKLFSGTPFGSVDVVSVEKDFNKYKTVAFLGWNTMTDEIFNKLKDYVYNGGELVISYCHLNTVDRNDLEPKFIENEKVEEFFGGSICGEYEPDVRVTFDDGTTYLIPNDDKINTIRFNGKNAKAICVDKFGNGVVFVNSYGKGKVYFGAFKDYFNKPWAIKTMTHLLESIGKNGDVVCDNKNVSFTIRKQNDGKYSVAVLNMNCLPNATENFNLKIYGKTISDTISVGEIKDYII